jgi:hypothetical protein
MTDVETALARRLQGLDARCPGARVDRVTNGLALAHIDDGNANQLGFAHGARC